MSYSFDAGKSLANADLYRMAFIRSLRSILEMAENGRNLSFRTIRHDTYVSLQKVERDFRLMKTGLLEVRPLFVRKESRTRGHVFCCMLALKLSREIERRLQAAFGTTNADPHTCTVPDAMAALQRLCLLEYQIDKKTTVTRLPKPDARQKEILAALQVHLPEK